MATSETKLKWPNCPRNIRNCWTIAPLPTVRHAKCRLKGTNGHLKSIFKAIFLLKIHRSPANSECRLHQKKKKKKVDHKKLQGLITFPIPVRHSFQFPLCLWPPAQISRLKVYQKKKKRQQKLNDKRQPTLFYRAYLPKVNVVI